MNHKTIRIPKDISEVWLCYLREYTGEYRSFGEFFDGHCCTAIGALYRAIPGAEEALKKYCGDPRIAVQQPWNGFLNCAKHFRALHCIEFFDEKGEPDSVPYLPTLQQNLTEANASGVSFAKIANAVESASAFIYRIS